MYRVRAGASGRSYCEEIAIEIGLVHEKISEIVSRRAESQGYESIIRECRSRIRKEGHDG